MAAKDAVEIPIGMRRVCRRLERWRSGHKSRLPIPNALWTAAAEATREHGVFRAAKTLRLDYSKLKRMMEDNPLTARLTKAPARFLKLTPSDTVGVAECLIDAEGPRGKIRIQWKGGTPPNLA